jgi:uncharacterized phage-associated protein
MAEDTTSVYDISAAIVERHQPIDKLKLQKIIFYAAGEYAALTGSAMFPEPIEAWDWGPVVYDLWQECRKCEDDLAIVELLNGDSSNLNELAIGCVESALGKYGERSGANLIDLTHKERAWKDAYVPGQWRTPIPLESLIESFRAKYEERTISPEVLDHIFARSAGA